jgi:hypothetical protein
VGATILSIGEKNINIYRSGSVPETMTIRVDEQDIVVNTMETMIERIIGAYETLLDNDPSLENSLTDKFSEIHIYPNVIGAKAYFYRNSNGKLIVGFRENRSQNLIRYTFEDIAWGIQPSLLNDSGTLEFTHINGDTEYSVSAGTETIGEIIIPATFNGKAVTAIAGSGFVRRTEITSIIIPNSITYIGTYAFSGCTGIKSVSLPATVELDQSPYQNAFYGCTSLELFTVIGNGPLSAILNGKALVRNNTELLSCPGASGKIILPVEITTISASAFEDNTNIVEIELPTSITRIDVYSFWQCYSLKKITCLAETPPVLGLYVFMGDNVAAPSHLSNLMDIKVPSNSLDSYKTATNWSAYAEIISAIE